MEKETSDSMNEVASSDSTLTLSTQNEKPASLHFFSGKYREIIIAVVLFLLIDLGVLVLNFYTSFQIAEDALGINLSGRQRMLSQRTAKALFAVDNARGKKEPEADELKELAFAVNLFNTTLNGFENGATVPGGDMKDVWLHAVLTGRGRQIVGDAQGIWKPYKERLAPVLSGDFTDAQLEDAVVYAKSNNLVLLGLMNDLTTELEEIASRRATWLRAVQTTGIVLVLLNFAFILFKFIRRLSISDAQVELVNKENKEILDSVQEGLFLITPDLRIGKQVSAVSTQMFGGGIKPGADFIDVLSPLVTPKILNDAREYVGLVFSPHVKESLIRSINPLTEVEVTVHNRLGAEMRRYLAFRFTRVLESGAGAEKGSVRHLLVTVQDVTDRRDLEEALETEKFRSQKEFDMLLKAFVAGPVVLNDFVTRAETALHGANDLLRSLSEVKNQKAIMDVLQKIARDIHAIKGEASLLELDLLAHQLHGFETQLESAKQACEADMDAGESLLPLPLALEDLLKKTALLKMIGESRRASKDVPPPPPRQALPEGSPAHAAQAPEVATDETSSAPAGGVGLAEDINVALANLAQQVAKNDGKLVQARVLMDAITDLAQPTKTLVREMAVQLVRNAVVHGIEPEQERVQKRKSGAGNISVGLMRKENLWTLSVRDDGAGLSVPRLREVLLKKGILPHEQLAVMSDQNVCKYIFASGVSTAQRVTVDAGRGTGMDLVREHIKSLGGRVEIWTKVGMGTEFKVSFEAGG